MENTSRNLLYLSGEIMTDLNFSHESHGSSFLSFVIRTQRLSGTYDEINALIPEELAKEHGFLKGDFIKTFSELRSFNKKTESGNRLIVSAFIKDAMHCERGFFENELTLSGTICKPPVYRKTPLGREICDIMLAINRRYGRSDYLPLIAWGKNAREASVFSTGDNITIQGRVQSRDYTKLTEQGEIKKVAYEVSISSIDSI